MNQFLEMFRKTHNSPLYDQIVRFARPLYDHFGINHFWYYRITHSGDYSFMGTHTGWTEYCFENPHLLTSFPCLRHPNTQQTRLTLMHSFLKDINYTEMQQLAWDKFNINFNINLTSFTSEGVHAFGFATHFNDPRVNEQLLNHLPELRYFIHLCREKHSKLFQLIEDSALNLGQSIGDTFYERSKEITLPYNRDLFLRALGCHALLSLTDQEKKILKYLAHGYPASHIKEKVHLSQRTVENYIATIKDKLSCDSKVELINKAKEMITAGFLEYK